MNRENSVNRDALLDTFAAQLTSAACGLLPLIVSPIGPDRRAPGPTCRVQFS
jgi:hypothetical protein